LVAKAPGSGARYRQWALLAALRIILIAFARYRTLCGRPANGAEGVLIIVKIRRVLALATSWAYRMLIYEVVRRAS
jgi:hypothetical protein